MARIAGSSGASTAAAIRRVGLRLIHRHGYEAMGLRQLAAEVGIRPGSLYNHIASKQDLLFRLIEAHLLALIAAAEAALEAAPADPPARLRAFVTHHVLYHLGKEAEVTVANFELRALDPPGRARIVALRRRYEALLITLLEAGRAEGRFVLTDPRVAAYAILAMLTGACTWYRPDGRLSPAELAAIHAGMVLRSCGLAPEEGAS